MEAEIQNTRSKLTKSENKYKDWKTLYFEKRSAFIFFIYAKEKCHVGSDYIAQDFNSNSNLMPLESSQADMKLTAMSLLVPTVR